MNLTPKDLDDISEALFQQGIHPDAINTLIDCWRASHPNPVQEWLSNFNVGLSRLRDEPCVWIRYPHMGYNVLTGTLSGYGHQFHPIEAPIMGFNPTADYNLPD